MKDTQNAQASPLKEEMNEFAPLQERDNQNKEEMMIKDTQPFNPIPTKKEEDLLLSKEYEAILGRYQSKTPYQNYEESFTKHLKHIQIYKGDFL